MKFDSGPYVERYRAEAIAEAEAIRTRAASALAEARRIAEAIRHADPSVRRVLLFGSLAEGTPRRKDFDVDLAIDGGDLFPAMDAAGDSPFEVDIVRLDRVPSHVRRRIEARGVVLSAEG